MGACASNPKTQEGPARTQEGPGRILLTDAVKTFENIQEVSRLLESGANPNETKGRLKRTPLHWAVDNRNKEIVVLLLKYGANPSIKDIFCHTALDLAKLAGEKAKELIPLLEKEMSPAALK